MTKNHMDLQQHLIPLNDEASWNKALLAIPNHFYTHTHWYNTAMSVASQRDIYLYEAFSNDFHVICPISSRVITIDDAEDITTPYGFSGFIHNGVYENFSEKWHAFMQGKGYVCGHIAQHPLIKLEHLFNSCNQYKGKTSYLIDITLPVSEIYKNFSDDHRHRLRQWQKAGYEINTSKTNEIINAFIKHYASNIRIRNAAAIYDFGEVAWREILKSECTHLFSVLVNGEVQAAAVFINYNNIVDYYMIASSDEGRAHARGIIFSAINYFHNKKAKWLHLGCGVYEDDALAQFKARFGARTVATYALKQIYNTSRYEQLCEKYDCDSTDLQSYFPPYWKAKENKNKGIVI